MQKKNIHLLSAAGICLVVVLILSAASGIRSVLDSGITKGPDQKFGDQNLKTVVALIELHKVRYGKYPGKLSDLKFIGDWDGMALKSVSYYPNSDRTAYYVEVQRGWIGKPHIEMPEEFWQGTGYNEKLRPLRP